MSALPPRPSPALPASGGTLLTTKRRGIGRSTYGHPTPPLRGSLDVWPDATSSAFLEGLRAAAVQLAEESARSAVALEEAAAIAERAARTAEQAAIRAREAATRAAEVEREVAVLGREPGNGPPALSV
jgi:hypothetical protein